MIKLINEFIIKKIKTRFRLLHDETLFVFRAITSFFDYAKEPIVNSIEKYHSESMPISAIFNKTLNKIETDVNLIYQTQQITRANLLKSWNLIETLNTKYETPFKKEEIYDTEFALEHLPAIIDNSKVLSGVENETPLNDQIKDKPIAIAETSAKEVPVYYGKMYGVYAKGLENSDDKLRQENRDTSVMVDGRDTIWECEAVVLEEPDDELTLFQPLTNKNLILTATVKFIFKEPIKINEIAITPFNNGVNNYYRIAKFEVSDGIKIYPIDVNEQVLIETLNLRFNTPREIENGLIKSLSLTFKQESGYNLKYSVGYFKIENNEGWMDITGPHVVSMAQKKGENFYENLTTVIETAPEWILNYWLPGITYGIQPERIITYGINGFRVISSAMSKRKRYTIGITNIILKYNEYGNISETVTMPISIPNGSNTISLDAATNGAVYSYISFNDGLNWQRIIPIGNEDVPEENLRIIPKKIYVNSILSAQRKENTITGSAAYIESSKNEFRLRFVLKKENGIEPSITSWAPIFGVEL